ncbi:MAG: hypothetical protein LBB75_02950 [Oscillospiraceae bacterium]|jgi:hypothetical protein|nr:hypothetical protein [Oscillospiraceae bacterium]
MKHLAKAIAALLAACLLAMACGAPALAAQTNLPDGFLIDDEDGISVRDAGGFFLHAPNLMPGDVVIRTLTLRNLEQGEPFRLHMLGASPSSAGPAQWLDNLHLRITQDGREVYAGRLRGDGKDTHTMKGNGADLVNEGLDLGLFETGGYGSLEFTVTADAAHMSEADLFEPSSANIDWVFVAVKDAAPDPPKTGDAARYGMVILLLALAALIAVFYRRYRQMRIA